MTSYNELLERWKGRERRLGRYGHDPMTLERVVGDLDRADTPLATEAADVIQSLVWRLEMDHMIERELEAILREEREEGDA